MSGLSVVCLGLLFLLVNGFTNNRPFRITFVIDRNNMSAPCNLIEMTEVAQHRLLRDDKPLHVSSHPQTIEEGGDHHDHSHHDVDESSPDYHVIKAYGATKDIALEYFNEQCSEYFTEEDQYEATVADEVIPIVSTGPPSNRIDLVFMGDGYTQDERQEMLSDMSRLIEDMFTGTTFTPYIPLFNVWVVFRPSVESGIGIGGQPKNTAFRLYRDGTQLRGVYCGNAPGARDACKAPGPDACDFPTLIGNSPYYGGLGGEFTISTSSETSGTIVLRHELGHNFGSVGEEYDGGTAYFGANFANSAAQANLKWRQWLNEIPLTIQQDTLLLQDYPWYLLEEGPRSYLFTSTGTYDRWYLVFTASGAPDINSISVFLDNVPLQLSPPGTDDRTFYKFYSETPFTRGTHQLLFRQTTPPGPDGAKRQLCSLTLKEYKSEPEFNWEEYYSAYQDWRQGGALVGYRPTNEKCLMRNMNSPDFCNVCKENMWLQFFRTVSAIDSLTQSCADNFVKVVLQVMPLAHFRENPVPGELYVLTWTRNGILEPDYDDLYTWEGMRDDVAGTWIASLKFITPEVRADPSLLLDFEATLTIDEEGPC